MQFLHDREFLNQGDVVVVDCSHRCNVHITDDINFSRYQSRQQFQYYGGHHTHFPVRIAVPYAGYWNVVLDLGGGSANIRSSFRYIKAA